MTAPPPGLAARRAAVALASLLAAWALLQPGAARAWGPGVHLRECERSFDQGPGDEMRRRIRRRHGAREAQSRGGDAAAGGCGGRAQAEAAPRPQAPGVTSPSASATARPYTTLLSPGS